MWNNSSRQNLQISRRKSVIQGIGWNTMPLMTDLTSTKYNKVQQPPAGEKPNVRKSAASESKRK